MSDPRGTFFRNISCLYLIYLIPFVDFDVWKVNTASTRPAYSYVKTKVVRTKMKGRGLVVCDDVPANTFIRTR